MFKMVLFFMLLFVVSCTNIKWTSKPVNYLNTKILYIPLVNGDFQFKSTSVHSDAANYIEQIAADSLAILSLQRVMRSPSIHNQGVQITDTYSISDYQFRISVLRIRKYPTLNFVRPGPSYRVDLYVEINRGDQNVMRGRFTNYGNMASLASDKVGIYVPTKDERNDPDLQYRTIERALYTSLGDAWMKFFQLDF